MTGTAVRVDFPPGQRLGGERSVTFAAAEEFLRLLYQEQASDGELSLRLNEVRREIERTGSYRHTGSELGFGARVAWRNADRCIGRLYWRSLKIRDRRGVTDAADIAEECFAHLREVTRGGRIRSAVTIFAPDSSAGRGPRIRNEQLIRYAAYRGPGETVLGDPRNLAFTEFAQRLGWCPPRRRGPFDLLPLIVETAGSEPRWFALPADVVLEVPLSHPDLPWFAELGLRWHAVPVISHMPLEIGGVRYPAAPFNGWYMGTEVGARNLADTGRYDLLPLIARRLGLRTGSERTLWRDRAMVELTAAVHHSFDLAGVTITDHHTEAHRFLEHLRREEAAGRRCRADWSWIVPPLSGSQTPVFHRYYDPPDPGVRPAFLPAEPAGQPGRANSSPCTGSAAGGPASSGGSSGA
ncbi:nitric oxide synthase oxygenase [Amycolatopsis magusensis]|uniref:nitric oxide synthase oxygenase n=1 Tax=Amycolatopsis magusensis TaxID=882444 RepID=UPI0024A868FB|nr:nitric oxide synthase oxygenase [Amycolatopsis magusensis]MDI5979479.1 nitric oxide synthase oxygenase [Amycolatopsis magusensis]